MNIIDINLNVVPSPRLERKRCLCNTITFGDFETGLHRKACSTWRDALRAVKVGTSDERRRVQRL